MSADFSVLNARARGLAAHLVSRAELESLAELRDARALAASLVQHARLATAPEGASVAALELSVRRTAERHLRTLARWCAEDDPALEVFYAGEDRRSLRAMLRGAVQGAPAEARLAALIPTPRLPERALHELARQPTPRDVAAHLLVLGDPQAARLLALTARAQPDLAELELALVQALAERLRTAAKAGDRVLREHVADRIDLDNAQAALLLAGGRHDLDARACFVEGGRVLAREAYAAAVATKAPGAALPVLARAFAGSPLGRVLAQGIDDPARLEAAALGALLEKARRVARLEPLSSAPLLVFLLRLEAQSRDVLRLAQGVWLEVPPAVVREGFVTPWN